MAKIDRLTEHVTAGLNINKALLRSQTKLLIYDGMPTEEILKVQTKTAASLISVENFDMTFAAAGYVLADTIKRVTGTPHYHSLGEAITAGINAGRLNPKMATQFDVRRLNAAIDTERDKLFDYFGLQNVVDRYLLRDGDKKLIELPQQWLMRVAMGLALEDGDTVVERTQRAIEFYRLLSHHDAMSSTPTLFNSGTTHSQMSSCYVNTVNDQISADIEAGENRYASIYGTIEECARLSKHAGGIGTDWTRVRGSGAHILSTNGTSSGVLPYLKPYNDTAVAVNQGGKRKGSFAPYLESWHPDFIQFCEAKKEFGDDRLLTPDIFPASWLSDEFMSRVNAKDASIMWSFFDPHQHQDLHELYGEAFSKRYRELEEQGAYVKQMPVLQVWRTILTNLFETGHPWVTFKDACNLRSPQDHVGVIHNSNLCTEITLNNSDDETAVCNLGSINLAKHIDRKTGRCDTDKLRVSVRTMMRMLDNVIDLNYYPSDRSRNANLRHRPVGLGIMGETEAKAMLGIRFDSEESVEFSDWIMELVSFYAIEASCDLAAERGAYSTFEGSKWSRGILPIHTAKSQKSALGLPAWDALAARVARVGMRNSNCMAIAPTATISTITFTTPCIEPVFEIARGEQNISGDFLVVDPCVRWMPVDQIPTAFEIDATWVIKCGARRQKWIDQAQSLNIFVKHGTKGGKLSEIYLMAWKEGLKTTYYLRSQSKTAAAKAAPVAAPAPAAAAPVEDLDSIEAGTKFCSIDNPGCESCQ
ncbi:ribonucleoside-diphosphate reductase subunit alpha [Comamonas thiooxydans]|uniref:ribonucleoside-diphosphate reductase subunit alpha n=1 Tax=Comamonas thiooxydans TaxID=363952 RepID=UPI0018D28DAF|nr:ribonucleoside-diphosphate reductase subunit alpha [Comamonas thiooxydans]